MTYEIFTLNLTLTLALALSLAQATKLVTYEIFARSCTRAAAALERRLIPGSEGTLAPRSPLQPNGDPRPNLSFHPTLTAHPHRVRG